MTRGNVGRMTPLLACVRACVCVCVCVSHLEKVLGQQQPLQKLDRLVRALSPSTVTAEQKLFGRGKKKSKKE